MLCDCKDLRIDVSKREKKLDLVIQLLETESNRLIEEIKKTQGFKEDKMELKCQIVDAIKNLRLCSEHNLFADKVEIVEIPEGGSDSYFTGFYIVDEYEIGKVCDSAIKRDQNGKKISLSCFDIIMRKK